MKAQGIEVEIGLGPLLLNFEVAYTPGTEFGGSLLRFSSSIKEFFFEKFVSFQIGASWPCFELGIMLTESDPREPDSGAELSLGLLVFSVLAMLTVGSLEFEDPD